jgi:hypothetical protein
MLCVPISALKVFCDTPKDRVTQMAAGSAWLAAIISYCYWVNLKRKTSRKTNKEEETKYSKKRKCK